MGTGYLIVTVTTAENALPFVGAAVKVMQGGNELHQGITNSSGQTETFGLPAPDMAVTLDPNYGGDYFSLYDVEITAGGFPVKIVSNVMIFDTKTMSLPVRLTPLPATDEEGVTGTQADVRLMRSGGMEEGPPAEVRYVTPDNIVELPPHPLVAGGDRNPEYIEYGPARQRILREVVIPHYITVHLDRKEISASNVTVEFKYYIKNVCTHEIFPTWPQPAIEANIHCQVSLALNRIYTEFYRSQGYPFDITSSTWTDQNFVYQGEIDTNISKTVDRIFDEYARRIGHAEPYYTEYCDGIKTTCNGLKQWGTVTLANQGYTPLQMLRYYYGSDIELVESNNIADVEISYPGYTLTQGTSGEDVMALQNYLNRIRVNYPIIPRISPVDGIYGPQTSAAVKAFKTIAGWPQDASDPNSGNVDRATWYNISYAYYAVKKLAQLASEGEVEGVGRTPPSTNTTSEGATGTYVGRIQFLLNVIADFYPEVRQVIQDYRYGIDTTNAVRDFQKAFDLPQTGSVDTDTWRKLYEVYWNIIDSGLIEAPEIPPIGGMPSYPGSSLGVGSTGDAVRAMQRCLNNISKRYPSVGTLTEDGKFGIATEDAVVAFQNLFGLPADGVVGPTTWSRIGYVCAGSGGNDGIGMPVYPGYSVKAGASGADVKQIQRCLNNVANRYPAIPKLTEDGIFGAGTTAAVKAFQSNFGLVTDGVVGPASWQRLMEECQKSSSSSSEYPGYLISVGSSGDLVKQIQQCLTNISYRYPSIPKLTADGVFGNGTRSAVIAFQRQFGLTQDGVVGRTTWNKIFSECAGVQTVEAMSTVGDASTVSVMNDTSARGAASPTHTSDAIGAANAARAVAATDGLGASPTGAINAAQSVNSAGAANAARGVAVANGGGGCAATSMDDAELRAIAERAMNQEQAARAVARQAATQESGATARQVATPATGMAAKQAATPIAGTTARRNMAPATGAYVTPANESFTDGCGEEQSISRRGSGMFGGSRYSGGRHSGNCQDSSWMIQFLLMWMIMTNTDCGNDYI